MSVAHCKVCETKRKGKKCKGQEKQVERERERLRKRKKRQVVPLNGARKRKEKLAGERFSLHTNGHHVYVRYTLSL